MKSSREVRASKRFGEAWDALDSGNPEKAYGIINRTLWGGKSYRLRKELSQELSWLQNYEFPELKKITNEIKREFVLVISWNLLMKDHARDWGWALRENLSPFWGTAYELAIDVERMRKDLSYSEELPSPTIEQYRYNYWSELSKISGLSLLARSLFIRILRYAQVRSGGLANARVVGPLDGDDIKKALIELSQCDLISSDLSSNDLLMDTTINDLKEFAFENGLDVHGTKHQIIQAITLGVQEDRIKRWLHELNQSSFIRPLVKDFQLLKKYMWSASNEIGLYSQWLQQTKYLCKPIETIANEKKVELEAYRYRPLEPYRPLSKIRTPNYVWKTKKMRLLREVWDAECDTFLQGVAEKYAWDWELYIKEAISSQLSSEKLTEIKQVSDDDLYLRYFCQKRLAELGVDVRKPSLLSCAGCGTNFMGWSVDSSLAEQVGYKILFCKECYVKAFWGSRDATTDRDKMPEYLSTVATILGVVPTSSFRNRKLTLSNLTEENQIFLVKALIDMPLYKEYLNEFGSWLQALIVAGILEDGTQRTSRGIKCIANDGHVCNSLAEKTIDDWLSTHDIHHEKEPYYPYHHQLNTTRMRADWKVQDLLIEYAGMLNEPSYAAKMKAKQELAKEFRIAIMILEPKDILDLDKKLEAILSK